jgi:glucosamine--fructose-6-phosphate aminotransferase (isomerizing)
VAIYLGELYENISSTRADGLYKRLKDLGPSFSQTLKNVKNTVEGFVNSANTSSPWHFLGSGADFATAEYAAVKMSEAAALPSIWYEVEEWAHTGFFLASPGTPLIIIASHGPALPRIKELLPAVLSLDVDILVIASEQAGQFPIPEENIVRVLDSGVPQAFTPLLYALPVQWMALKLAERLKSVPFHLDDTQRLNTNSRQLYESREIESLDELDSLK